MKTLLVTGGAGFIGANFIRYWISEHPEDRVINLDKLTYAGNLESLADVQDSERYQFQRGDICDRQLIQNLLEQQNIDAIVNFAAESHVDRSILQPDEFIQTNVFGTFVLLDVARNVWGTDANTRFVHVSTDEVYGTLGFDDPAFTEATPYAPNSPYSASKASSDHLVRSYFHTYGLPVVTTNCSNNYGPYQFPEKLIPLVILNALDGKSLPVYGDGQNIRDWLYVTDHCRGIDAALQGGTLGETYNIGGRNEIKNLDLVRTICRHLDEKRPGKAPYEDLITYVKDRPGHDLRYAIDATKIQNELGWEPAIMVDQGIEMTVSWYLDHLDWCQHVRDGDYQKYYDQQYNS